MPVRRVHGPGSPIAPRRDLGAAWWCERRAPAEQADEVAEPKRHGRQPARHGHDARLAEAEPAPIRGERPRRATARSGPDDLERDAGWRVGSQEEQDGPTRSSSCTTCSRPGLGDRGHERQRREPAEQRAAAVGLPARRPPTAAGSPSRDRAPSAPRRRRAWCAEKAVGAVAVDADGRDLHDAPHARLLAGREQRRGARACARRPWSRGGRPAARRRSSPPRRCRRDAAASRRARSPVPCRARCSGPPAAAVGGAGAARDRDHLVPLAALGPPAPRARSGRSPPSAAPARQPPSSIRQCRPAHYVRQLRGTIHPRATTSPSPRRRYARRLHFDGLGGCGLVALLMNE